MTSSIILEREHENIFAVTLSASEFERAIVIRAIGASYQENLEFARFTHYEQSSAVRTIKNNEIFCISNTKRVKLPGKIKNNFSDEVFNEYNRHSFEAINVVDILHNKDVIIGVSISIERKVLARMKEYFISEELSRIIINYLDQFLENYESLDVSTFIYALSEECNDIFSEHAINGGFETDTFSEDVFWNIEFENLFEKKQIKWADTFLPQRLADEFSPEPAACESMASMVSSIRPDPDDLINDILAQNEKCFIYRVDDKYYDTPKLFYYGLSVETIIEITPLCKLAEFDVVTENGIKKRNFSSQEIVESLEWLTKQYWEEFLSLCLHCYNIYHRIVIIGVAPLVNIIGKTLSLFCSPFDRQNITFSYIKNFLPHCIQYQNYTKLYDIVLSTIDSPSSEICEYCGRTKHYFSPFITNLTCINGNFKLLSNEIIYPLFEEQYIIVDAIEGVAYEMKQQPSINTFRQSLTSISIPIFSSELIKFPKFEDLDICLLQEYFLNAYK